MKYHTILLYLFFFLLNSFSLANLVINNNFSNNKVIQNILSKEDLGLYEEALEYQQKYEWDKSKQILKKVKNKVLLGYFEYEKLMHPNKYRASYEELASWFNTYKDYPPVLRKRVYNLILKRAPSEKERLLFDKPKFGSYLRGYGEDRRVVKKYNKTDKKSTAILKNKIYNFFKEGNHEKVIQLINKNNSNRKYYIYLINKEINKVFFNGEIKESLRLYDLYINQLKIKSPNFFFRAGINAYRTADYKKALNYFNNCSNDQDLEDKWLKAGCFYWNAMLENTHKKKNLLLNKATKYPRTLYGQLAIEVLNVPEPFNWELERKQLIHKEINSLYRYNSFKRAIALSEISLYNYADLEMRNLYSVTDKKHFESLFYVSEELNLAAVLIRLSSKIPNTSSAFYMRGLYPTPQWHIKDGYLLDKAFLFALIRRESAFNFKAKSSKGARGLMQLMPRTASKLKNDYRLRYGNAYKLYSMQLNLQLGQKYLKTLFSNPNTNNSILDTLIAYNAGLSRLKKWKKNINNVEPIVFLESIPIKETRWFVKYIMTDLWVYRDKLRQEKPSRKLMSNKKWPVYQQLDYNYIQDAKYRR